MNQIKTRLQVRLDKRDAVQSKREQLFAEADGGNLSETDQKTDELYRSEIEGLDKEIEQLAEDAEAQDRADEMSKQVRRAMLGSGEGTDVDEDGVVYRSMAAYARDFILTRTSQSCSKIAAQFGDKSAIEAASQRLELLKRTPANTLSSNVSGLQPAQHIDQIFQVIDKSRPLVASARRSTLDRGTLTYPKVTSRPVVAVQATEKTEAGNTGMVVDMETATASTYLGGGDLSWQAINWSTPDALQLWFDLAAADYALKTEQDAAQVLLHSAFNYNVASTLGATPTFAEFLTAVGAGGAEVFANSGRLADSVYMSIDRYWYLFGLTSTATAQFTQVNIDGIGKLNVVASRGLDSGTILVGDRAGMLVAETAGAPVELRVVEPAIGGLEVGIIGAFEAVIVDDGAFSLITTAS